MLKVKSGDYAVPVCTFLAQAKKLEESLCVVQGVEQPSKQHQSSAL